MNIDRPIERPARTLTETLRVRFKPLLDGLGGLLNRTGLTPNHMTLIGLAGNAVGAYLLSRGLLTAGGLVILAMGPVDALDGTMARLRGEPEKFGAFVDSVTDRWSELVIFLGLLYLFAERGETGAALLVFAAAAGSVMVSYTKARAEALGFDAKIGLLSRLERYLVLAPALVFRVPLAGLAIIAVFANITALQRALHVRRQARQRPSGGNS